MKLGLVAEWNSIKSRYKQLGNPKFKPDLGPLLAKYEAGFDELDSLQKQIEALKSGLLPFLKDLAAARNETKSQVEETASKLRGQFGSDYQKFFNDYGDGSDWDAVQKACNSYLATVKTFIAALDDTVKQLTQSRDTSAKTEMTGINQYLVKRKQVEDRRKKVNEDVDRLQSQIPQVVATYNNIARQMKDDDLATAINSILRKLPTPV